MESINVIDLVAQYGYVAVFIIVAIENIEFFGSIPTSLIAATLGAASSQGIFTPWVAITILTVSSVTGDVIGYWLGRYFGRPILVRWGGALLKSGRLEKMESFFSRFGVFGVFISRFIFASFQAVINILSGISKMKFLAFFFSALLGEFVWSLLYFFLGYFFWPAIENKVSSLLHVRPFHGILVVALVSLAVWIFFRIRNARRRKEKQ